MFDQDATDSSLLISTTHWRVCHFLLALWGARFSHSCHCPPRKSAGLPAPPAQIDFTQDLIPAQECWGSEAARRSNGLQTEHSNYCFMQRKWESYRACHTWIWEIKGREGEKRKKEEGKNSSIFLLHWSNFCLKLSLIFSILFIVVSLLEWVGESWHLR